MYKKYYELKESLRKEIMDRIGVDKDWDDEEIARLIDEVIFEMQLKNPNISTAEKQEILARKAMADVTKNMRAVVKDYFNNLLSNLKK